MTDNFVDAAAKAAQAASTLIDAGATGAPGLPDGMFPPPHINFGKPLTEEDEKKGAGVAGLLQFDYKIHRRVFVLWRPFGECAQCTQALGSGQETLPESETPSLSAGMKTPTSSNYTCPHTDVDAYEETVNDSMAGKTIFGGETENVLKDGTVIVSLKWYSKESKPKKAE